MCAAAVADDHNRVRLIEMDDVEGSDYINASYVDVSTGLYSVDTHTHTHTHTHHTGVQ